MGPTSLHLSQKELFLEVLELGLCAADKSATTAGYCVVLPIWTKISEKTFQHPV